MPDPIPLDSLPPHLSRLVDALCDSFERGWQAGSPQPLESLLPAAPNEARPALFAELFRIERESRQRTGKPLTPDEARRRFASLGPWAAPLLASLAEPPAGFRVTLTVTSGPHQSEAFEVDGHRAFVIGRDPSASAILAGDPYLSRLHFLLEVNPPACQVSDLGSLSGTFVNGNRVTQAVLANGDVIRAGTTSLRVTVAGPSGPPSTLELPPEVRGETPTRLAEVPPSVRPPVVPGYRIERVLGEGGMGAVYLARAEADGRAVALKTIRPSVRPDEVMLERFRREVDVLRGLSHPRIVGLTGHGEAGGLLWFAMEYIEGVDAAALVKRDGPLEVGRAVRLTLDLLDGLAHAHGRKYVHRDVKPANLLVAQRDGREAGVLADFGLARVYQESAMSGLTLAGSAGGTPQFMAPEQVTDFRSAKPPADGYSTAATLYFLLTGKYLFDLPEKAGVQAWLRAVMLDTPVSLDVRRPGLPAGLVAAVTRGLAKEPKARHADAGAMRRALEPFAGG